jgi:hypothetical protein
MLFLAGMAWGATARTRSNAPRAARTHAVKKSATRHVATATKRAAASNRVAPIPSGAAGMRIFRDPETGEVGPPTAENVRQLAFESQSRPVVDLSNLPQKNLGDGRGWMIDTHEAEESIVMTIDKNGNRVIKCVSSKDADPKKVAKGPAVPVREDR